MMLGRYNFFIISIILIMIERATLALCSSGDAEDSPLHTCIPAATTAAPCSAASAHESRLTTKVFFTDRNDETATLQFR